LVVLISEVSKKSSIMGALFASIPIVSILGMIWLYIDTKDVSKISDLSIGIFWLVIPSLILFLILPLFLKQGMGFYSSIILSILITAAAYALMVILLGFFNIKI
tara:strand:- start:286 stop:597 length:312 start_codon:yes stop_codon:yes gene_type:complete